VTVNVSLLLLLTGRVEGRVVLLQWFSSDNTAPPSTPHLRMSDGKTTLTQGGNLQLFDGGKGRDHGRTDS
jgi:hypothetical protein